MRAYLVLLAGVLGCGDNPKPGAAASPDADGDGWTADQDCDDGSSAIHPEAPEVCDRLDNDCDGQVDENPADVAITYPDADGDGYGDASAGVASCDPASNAVTTGGDCDDADATVHPSAPEICDDRDDDCDGLVDESAVDAEISYADADGDGYGDADAPGLGCETGQGSVATAGDCDDANGSVHPGATQACGEVDNDCDPSTVGDTGVSMTAADGTISDETALFAAGTETSPAEVDLDGGDWRVCDGNWYVHLRLSGTVSLAGTARQTTVLNGGFLGSVLTVASDGASVSVSDLTLTEGNGTMRSWADRFSGGALACGGESTVSLTNLFLIGNEADVGGGIYDHGCSMTLDNLYFWNNQADMGGGIFIEAGQITIANSEMLGNLANLSGGGIGAEADGGTVTVSLTDTLIHNNTAYYGGGIALLGAADVSCTGATDVEAGIESNIGEKGGGVFIGQEEATNRFTADACDFEGSGDPNNPDDIEIVEAASYLDLGQDASFTCDEASCR